MEDHHLLGPASHGPRRLLTRGPKGLPADSRGLCVPHCLLRNSALGLPVALPPNPTCSLTHRTTGPVGPVGAAIRMSLSLAQAPSLRLRSSCALVQSLKTVVSYVCFLVISSEVSSAPSCQHRTLAPAESLWLGGVPSEGMRCTGAGTGRGGTQGHGVWNRPLQQFYFQRSFGKCFVLRQDFKL